MIVCDHDDDDAVIETDGKAYVRKKQRRSIENSNRPHDDEVGKKTTTCTLLPGKHVQLVLTHSAIGTTYNSAGNCCMLQEDYAYEG